MIEELSYIGFASPAAKEWETFGPEVLGLQLAEERPDAPVRLRMDDAAYRVAVHPGEQDDLAYLGWGVGGPVAFTAAVEKLTAAGIDVRHGDADLAADRQVTELAWFTDPFGLRNELSWGLAHAPATFRPGRAISGFVTADAGVGHAVLVVPDLAAAEAFYVGLLGFRLSDQIDMAGMRLRFYHCNSRHHSLAMAEVPGAVGFHHLMLEVTALDDVGTGLDLVSGGAAPLTMGLGRHSNDRMTSFYVRTPSGFDIEYGYGGVLVDDDAPGSTPAYTAMSIWGHHAPADAPPPGIVRPYEGSPA